MIRIFSAALVLVAINASAELRAGAAKRSIVPPFPTHMGGFGDRMQLFEGVHDEIFARALVLDNGETQIVIIGSGLMNLDENLTAGVRKRVTEETGIPGDHVMVSCVHNHSAPSYYQCESDADKKKARDFFVQQFSDAVIAAYEAREPAELGYANGNLPGVTRNRQQENETVLDTQVGVLRVNKRGTRDIIAVLWNFTGHPVILGSENLQISGEWPGYASRTIEKVFGGIAVPTQGACGDVTVHRQGDPFDEVQRLGRLVAGEVIKTVEFIRPAPEPRLDAKNIEFDLLPKALPSVHEAKQALVAAQATAKAAEAAGADRNIIRVHENRTRMLRAFERQAEQLESGELERPDRYPGSVQVLQIGDLVLVGIPGELFVEYGLELRQRVAQTTGKSMCLVGYANGYVGYIATPRAFETGGYEVSVQRVEARTGRMMTERAMALVHDVVR